MPIQRILRLLAGAASVLVWSVFPATLLASTYTQINLVSDIPGNAAITDPNLVDPWGMSFTATSPFWVSDNGTDKSTLYTGAPSVAALVVSVAGGPTGQVNNANASAFKLSDGTAATFIFDTQAGTILGWNGGLGTTAGLAYTNPNSAASYTGLAIGTSSGNSYLYAANAAGTVDVFDSTFTNVNSTTFAGKFVDPSLPSGYVPYNVQLIGTKLYVTYVEYDSGGSEIPSGIVDVYDTAGNFLGRFSSSANLDAPWGITLAPATFGSFGGDILIGNFLNGEINAFDPVTGAYLGTLDGSNGLPIANPGLWALDFRTGGAGNNTNALYFTAGIDDETHGLFGAIVPTPEPASFALAGMGMLALALARRSKTLASHNG
jgi:uncharacterized protein (TIGR03118 family)